MNETINTTAQADEVPQVGEEHNTEEKTFTQGEVNKIVSDRLRTERKKLEAAVTGEYTAELAERERDILQRELKMDAKERLQEAGLPPSAAKLLRYDDEETYKQSLEDALAVIGEIVAPTVDQQIKERLKGTTPKAIPVFSSDPLKSAFAPPK